MKSLAFCLSLLLACAAAEAPAARFGPKTEEEAKAAEAKARQQDAQRVATFDYRGPPLILAIPLLDPGLGDADEALEDEVWPELRRAESVRLALKLKEALAQTRVFSEVLVAPDSSISADFFLLGRIEKSNGEDLALGLELFDTTGKAWFPQRKTFSHRANDRWHEDPAQVGVDPFVPVYVAAAEAVAKAVAKAGRQHAKQEARNQKQRRKGKPEKVRESELGKLVLIRQLLFARALSPELYGDAVADRKGRWSLAYAPATDDENWGRVQAMKAADSKFLEFSGRNYALLGSDMDEPYLVWQREAYPIAKAARKARSAARWQLAAGILGAVAGIAAAADGAASEDGEAIGAAVAAAGVAAIASSFRARAEHQGHAELLNELGQSVQGNIAPKLVEMEGRQVKLSGTAAEQLAQWRGFLQEVYDDASVDPDAITILAAE